VKLAHLVGFITKKFVTMHGHMNVKKKKTNDLPSLGSRLRVGGAVPLIPAFVSVALTGTRFYMNHRCFKRSARVNTWVKSPSVITNYLTK